jgi:hypothetical protein
VDGEFEHLSEDATEENSDKEASERTKKNYQIDTFLNGGDARPVAISGTTNQ